MTERLSPCPACQQPASISAAVCPSCGHPLAKQAPATRRKLKTGIIIASLFGGAALILLGNFHVVSGADGKVLIKRLSFGYEDAFGSVSDCTAVPWIAALARHGKLCRALQEAGILESDEAREDRMRSEIDQEMKATQKEIAEQMEKVQREMKERMNELMRNF